MAKYVSLLLQLEYHPRFLYNGNGSITSSHRRRWEYHAQPTSNQLDKGEFHENRSQPGLQHAADCRSIF